jgi:uncharacterized membrane protein
MNEKLIHSKKLLERITMFNDAVYAIVLTLLVLELKLPEHESLDTPGQMWHAIVMMKSHFFAFLLSVLLVGSNWISSVNIQRIQEGADLKYLVFIVIYLAIISLAPFLCSLIGNYPDNPLSYILFGVVMELLSINGYLYVLYVKKMRFFHEGVNMVEVNKLIRAIPLICIFIALMTAVSVFSTKAAFLLFLSFNLLPFFIAKDLGINHKE